ncbi:phosphotransacetylase family protein [Desulfonatronovibrio hydrogenovorans]|uniref:phosphotransacetylase family protein n=1 Tax=Desulfonatronovibrio hydrogenovorans TaxID=53245 RepID=UPI00048B2335|nr:DRTGG domain-containing protein [Desulfonatronovibrio hydrogenovorans]
MVGLYIGSTAGFSGKNLITLALGKKFQDDGFKLGFMKPVGAIPKEINGMMVDEDAYSTNEFLDIKSDPSKLTPVLVSQDFKMKAYSGECLLYRNDIKKAYDELSQNKEIMLVGGSGSFLYSGKYCQLDGYNISRLLDSKVVIIDRYFRELNYDYLIAAQEVLGDKLLGVILNDVPEYFMQETREFIVPMLENRQVKVLGIIPHDDVLKAITIGDLASQLGGKIISMHAKADQIIQSFLIGTMQIENFMTHFHKNKNVAVIVGGDRSDLQLVALEGNCPCLILTGNIYPNDIILTRSEVLGIPIIVAREDTFTVAQKMENILNRTKLREAVKINQGCQVVNENLDYDALYKGLGISPTK